MVREDKSYEMCDYLKLLSEKKNVIFYGNWENEKFFKKYRKDLIEMAQHFRPQVTKNIVKGVVSNIPLPIPINPVSVVCTGYDIMKEIDFDKKYGWIYFYLDNKK